MNVYCTHLCPWLMSELAALEAALAADRLGHGWIFAGPPGIGKLNLALVFATRATSGQTSAAAPAELDAGQVEPRDSLQDELVDHHPDLHIVWPTDGKRSIGVEQIRALIDDVNLTSHGGRGKFAIIEPAEAMTPAAANALLKTLEEPSGSTRLILVSHAPGRLPATVRSRCQRLAVSRPDDADVVDWLGAGVGLEANPLIAGDALGPLQAATLIRQKDINDYNKIDNIIDLIYQKKIDAGQALEQCGKLDRGLVLDWIDARLRREIRRRVRAGGTTDITEGSGDLPENRWRLLPTANLIRLLNESAQVRNQLGIGLNEQLAIELVLGGFAASTESARVEG